VRPGRAADHSPPSSAVVMEEQSYTSNHPLGHTGPVKGSLYLYMYIYFIQQKVVLDCEITYIFKHSHIANQCICTYMAYINPLNAELNPICHLLALLGAHHIFHVSRVRVNTRCHTCKFMCSIKQIVCRTFERSQQAKKGAAQDSLQAH